MKFNKLIPEISVSDLKKSKTFYIENLGFKIEYERPEDKFVFLSYEEIQIMIEEISESWKTGELEHPFGRGINFQMEISNPESMYKSLRDKGVSFFKEISRNTYKTPNGNEEQTEFLIQDPDGYLLRCKSHDLI